MYSFTYAALHTELTSPKWSHLFLQVAMCPRDKCNHKWDDCPYAHDTENAQRRDPSSTHYTQELCPFFATGSCLQGARACCAGSCAAFIATLCMQADKTVLHFVVATLPVL